MLRRSFAEFHAQRAQPELLQALERGQAALARLHARPWPASPLGTTRCGHAMCCVLCSVPLAVCCWRCCFTMNSLFERMLGC